MTDERRHVVTALRRAAKVLGGSEHDRKQAADVAGWALYKALYERDKKGHADNVYREKPSRFGKISVWMHDWLSDHPGIASQIDEDHLDLFFKRVLRHVKKYAQDGMRFSSRDLLDMVGRIHRSGSVPLDDKVNRRVLLALEEKGLVVVKTTPSASSVELSKLAKQRLKLNG